MNKNLFNTVQVKDIKSNTFDLTHDVKLTGQFGNLIPVLAMECVPGDNVTLGADLMVRLAPLIAPVMHRMDATIHYFFVPNRLTFPDWEDFITTNEVLAAPTISINDTLTLDQQRFLDYLGIPPIGQFSVQNAVEVNALPMAAYQCIYSEYYRDQNLVPEFIYELAPGINSNVELLKMRKRAYEHDYFTAALPFAQKGNPVNIPLGQIDLDPTLGTPLYVDSLFNAQPGNVNSNESIPGAISTDPALGAPTGPMYYDPDGTLIVQATTINDLRRAFKLQEWLEKNARGGTRYIEHIKMHFNVQSSDKRLQRPEYITGTKSPVVISEVLNTTGDTGAALPLPQGNMAGHGVSIGQGFAGSYYVEEHGYIMGILSVMPKAAYMQGIPRHFLKKDPLDYYYPSFANIGEQAIFNEEIFAYSTTGTETWGYIPRYAEYKFMENRVSGEFRDSLLYWTLVRDFATAPQLSQEFIECDPAEFNERIFAVDDRSVDKLYIQVLNKIRAVRKMPVYGTPML